MYSATGEKFLVFGCSKVLVIDVNGYFSAAGGQNSEHLYQMSTFSYWNLHLQSLESNFFAPAAGCTYYEETYVECNEFCIDF